MSPDWFSALLPELQKPYFKSIQTFLAQDSASHKIYPPDHLRYSFTKCPLDNIKVVVLGQDPYHGPGQAHGLAFSVQKGVAVPPSLGNMFTELEREFAAEGKKFRRPGHGCLEGWVGQGASSLCLKRAPSSPQLTTSNSI